jgi:hypothetical protein
VNRRDFQLLSAVRLKEAKALLKAGFPDGAYYLAGYSVECALKACIAKSTQRYDFPDKTRASESYTHNLTQLVKTAKLDATLTTLLNIDILFRDNWEAVKKLVGSGALPKKFRRNGSGLNIRNRE